MSSAKPHGGRIGKFLLWFFGVVFAGFLSWMTVRYIKSRPSVTLSDGTVINYLGHSGGKPVSSPPNGRTLFNYDLGEMDPLMTRLERGIHDWRDPKHPTITPHYYRECQRMLWLKSSRPLDWGSDLHANIVVFNGFETGPFWGLKSPIDKGWFFRPVPQRDEWLEIVFRDSSHRELGRMKVPNPCHQAGPSFQGKATPLDAKASNGSLRLVEAKYHGPGGEVVMEFDSSKCPVISPVQIISVQIMDAFGNIAEGRPAKEPRPSRFWIKTRPGVQGLQDANWRVRVWVCRGPGASFSPSELVTFHVGDKSHKLRGREIKRKRREGSAGSEFDEDRSEWIIDADPPLWPIPANISGKAPDGTRQIVNLRDSPFPGFVVSAQRWDPWDHVQCTFFRYPSNLTEIELEMALEEATEFEFEVKVEGWPSEQK